MEQHKVDEGELGEIVDGGDAPKVDHRVVLPDHHDTVTMRVVLEGG